MKEKNIVDFTKMMKVHNEYYDENGDAVGCEICYTHQKAYEKLSGVNISTEIPKPVCPICGGPLSRRFSWTENGSDIVSEVNYSNPEGEIGFYSIWECGNCGYHFIGEKAPETCPLCEHPKAYFFDKEEIL